MAAYLNDGSGRRTILSDDLALELLAEGNNSEVEGFSDGDEDVLPRDVLDDILGEGVTADDNLDEGPSTSFQPVGGSSKKKKGKKKTRGRKKPKRKIWKQTTYLDRPHDFSELLPNPLRLPIDYFSDYLNDKFFELAADCSNTYHKRKTGFLLYTNAKEMRTLVAIHIIMGCIQYPRLCMYWRTRMKLLMITEHMSRDRFIQLRSALHVVPTDTQPNDSPKNPLWKVQPVIDMVKKACNALERTRGYYSIDEQMIPFCGRCSLRQVVKNKPRPVGLKIFVATTSEGLMVDFDIYLGANTAFSDKSLGVGPSVILHLAKSIPPGSCLYFDRFFSTIPLMEKMSKLNLHGTATIMFNRIPERHTMPFKKDKAMTRGESQQFVHNDVSLVKWKDNKSVVITSNCTGADTTQLVQRWDKKQKGYVSITAPKIIRNYNQHMGGVDVLDQMMEYYRTYIKTRKWTLKVLIHFIDLTIVNAWRLYRNQCISNKIPKNKIMDLLTFRLEIADNLLATPDRKRRLDSSSDDENDEEIPSKS